MSLVFIIQDADFSNSGLPKLVETIAGFPTDNLQALYLFEEGNQGQIHAGQFIDSSNNGNHATLRGDWSQPTRDSQGMIVAAGGISIASPVVFGDEFTFVIAQKLNQPIPSADAYFSIFCPAQDAPSSMTTSASVTNGKMFLNSRFFVNGNSDWAVYGNKGVLIGETNLQRKVLTGSINSGNTAMVAGITYKRSTNTLTVKAAAGEFRTNSAKPELFDALQNFCFGQMRSVSGDPQVAAGGKIYMSCIYNTSSEALLDEVIIATKNRVAQRGVTLV